MKQENNRNRYFIGVNYIPMELAELVKSMKMGAVKPHRSCISITRRIFLDVLTRGIFVAVAGLFIYPIIRYLIPPKRAAQNSGVVEVNAAEITAGKFKIVNYKETPTIVINTADGLFALTAVCTHLGCIVQWDEGGHEIVCPCHGARYDLDGNVKSGPAPKPLTRVKAAMSGDKILVGEA